VQILYRLVCFLFSFDLVLEFFPIFRRDGLKCSKQQKKSLLFVVCFPESFRSLPKASEFGMRDYDDILCHTMSSTCILPPGTLRAFASGNVLSAMIRCGELGRPEFYVSDSCAANVANPKTVIRKIGGGIGLPGNGGSRSSRFRYPSLTSESNIAISSGVFPTMPFFAALRITVWRGSICVAVSHRWSDKTSYHRGDGVPRYACGTAHFPIIPQTAST
jgi:hypothetical protein